MATRKPNRAVQIVAGLAAFGLLAGLLVGVFVGVGGGGGTTTSSTSTMPTTTVPLTAEQYRQRVSEASRLITDAEGQRCALAVAYTDVQALPPPAGPEQVEALIGVTLELLRASAESASVDQPEVSTQLAATADRLAGEAEAAGYSQEWLTSQGNEDSALADPAFNDAFTEYQELTFETCFADGDPAGAGGAGSEGSGSDG